MHRARAAFARLMPVTERFQATWKTNLSHETLFSCVRARKYNWSNRATDNDTKRISSSNQHSRNKTRNDSHDIFSIDAGDRFASEWFPLRERM